MSRFLAFCRAHPTDGVCAPQKEFPLSLDDDQRDARLPGAGGGGRACRRRPQPSRACAPPSPSPRQSSRPCRPTGLARIRVPVAIILGDADPVAPPDTNGLVAAKAIPHAELKVLPGVGHYDFLSTCTPAGKAGVPICNAKVSQDDSHQAAIDMALAFFRRTLGSP